MTQLEEFRKIMESFEKTFNCFLCVHDFTGEINWDEIKPDGTPRKLLDVSKLAELGWHPQITLEKGLKTTYEWFLNNQENLRK